MKRLHIWRSNLRILENYHSIRSLRIFEKLCHDFYLLMGIEFLKSGDFDEVTIWRLHPIEKQKDYSFNVDGKMFHQKWVNDFRQCKNIPDISLFRGGFKEYCDLVKDRPNQLGKKLYLAAGKRTTPQYGGKYDKILVESETDLNNTDKRIPYYKTCNPFIFRPLNKTPIYDICIVSNFTQVKMKGQKFIIQQISKSKYLQSLKFIHFGNRPQEGKKLANQYNVKNIEFKGPIDRINLNKYLNLSKFGIVASTLQDGCPRVSTEILCSGTPLLIRNTTRLLPYYKKYGVVEFGDNNFEEQVKYAIYMYNTLYKELRNNIHRFSYKNICKKNIDLWHQ